VLGSSTGATAASGSLPPNEQLCMNKPRRPCRQLLVKNMISDVNFSGVVRVITQRNVDKRRGYIGCKWKPRSYFTEHRVVRA
jgi:hypothetical protein